MLFRQLFDAESGTCSYLLASGRGAQALIIDPVLEHTDQYLRLLDAFDLTLAKAVDTHLPADHLSGLGALRDRTRCITIMGRESEVDCVAMRMEEGDLIDIEGLTLVVMHTPGHTDDSYSLLLPDRI